MKINRITVTDFQAVKHVDIDVDRPILFLCGANEQGKSSIADAVRLALIDDSDRVDHKKDRGDLVRVGAAKGAKIVIGGEEFSAAVSLPSNVATRRSVPESDALVSSLCPSWFVSLSRDARRAFLFPLLGIATDPEQIAQRMTSRGANPEKLKPIVPLFGQAPWEDLEAEAKKCATRAKGAWEQITGEKWGATKADQWVPTVPAAPAEGTPASVQKAIDEIDGQLAKLNQDIGAANASVSLMRGRADRLAQLATAAELLERRIAAHATVKADLDELVPRLDALRAVESGKKVGIECDCPECGVSLVLEAGKLSLFTQDGDSEARAKAKWELPGLEKAFAVLTKAVANAERDVKTSQDARAERERLLAEPPIDTDETVITKLRTQIDTLRDQRRTHETTLAKMQAHANAKAGAEKARDAAAEKHRDVLEWLDIADLVGPSGIPGELLAEGLAPFNAKLAELAMLAGWDAPVIADDMSIRVGQHGYRLGSVSARYRADVLIATAIAIFSGLKFVMLDGIEVLVGAERSRLLKLMSQLAGSVLDTVILIGTLKEAPTRLPATFRVQWIEAGEVVPAEAQREAA